MDNKTREIMTKMAILDHLFRYDKYEDRLRILKELGKEMKNIQKELKVSS